MALEYLFDAELGHRAGMAPLTAKGEGILVGSGDGCVAGPAMSGLLRWTLFEQPGELVCTMSPLLRIETHDGAEIEAAGRGFAARDSAEESGWRVAATLRFHTDDTRDAWLDGALALWEGDFDEDTQRARYRAYLQRRGAVTIDGATRALTAAAVPPERWGRRRLDTLSDPEQRFYRSILRSFRAGVPPGPGELADAASELGLDVGPTLAKLARRDLVHDDPIEGGIVVAYPFSGRPTEHVVRFTDGREAFAMCAIDALGIAPMLGEPIEITSRDPLTGEQIRLDLDPDGHGGRQPQEAVVVCGASGRGECCTSCCPVLNFFASQDNATRWLASHPEVRGAVISIDEAIIAGRTVFGDILEER